MEWQKTKYLKIALTACGSRRDGYNIKTYNEFLKFLEKEELEIENRKLKIERWEKNMKIQRSNIDIAKENIIFLKNELEREGLRKDEKERLREKILDNDFHLADAEKYALDAKEWIKTEIETIEGNTIWLNNFYKVEGLMKIERMKDLNKGKNAEYYIS